MEAIAEYSILLNWIHEHESIIQTLCDTNTQETNINHSLQPTLHRKSTIAMSEHYKQYSSEISEFDNEISRFVSIFYDKILELYFSQFIEIKLSLSLNISMIFMCFDGLLLSEMNCSFMELLESSIGLAILVTFIIDLLSFPMYNQNRMLNLVDILDKPIQHELELQNATSSTNDNNKLNKKW